MFCLSSAGRIGLRIEGSGPPVVLLHSSMSSKTQWKELTEQLRGSYRLIAIDLLGYGETAMPSTRAGYSLRDEVRLVESVLAHELQPGEQIHLFGHSYGGVIALQLAMQSQRVRSLSLFEPIAFHLLPAGDPDLAMVEAVWSEIAGRMKIGDALGGAACFVDYWSGAGAFAQLREERQSVLAAQVAKILLEFRAVADESGNVAAYRRIEVPTRLIAGQWSPELAQRLTSMLVDILPNASCIEVAAGHMAPITHPALVNPIFEEFIRAVDASERRSVLGIPQLSETTAMVRGLGWSRAIAIGLLGIALSVLTFFATYGIAKSYVAYPLEESAWHEAPPGLPPGGTFAVISGDPLEPGPFVMRVKLPPGFALPPYRRPSEEQLIVLAGAIAVGAVDESGAATTRILTSGSYVSLPANEIHFANTKNGAVLQIIGMGPFRWSVI